MAIIETLSDNIWPLAASVLAIYLVRKIYIYYRLSQFKGPFGVGFSEIPHSWAILKPDTEQWYRHVTDTYGTSSLVSRQVFLSLEVPDLGANLVCLLSRTHCAGRPKYARNFGS